MTEALIDLISSNLSKKEKKGKNKRTDIEGWMIAPLSFFDLTLIIFTLYIGICNIYTILFVV